MKSELTVDKSREEAIIDILNQNDAKVGVEIGVFKGEFSKAILSGWNGRLYMVDPWRALGEEYLDSSNHAQHTSAYSDTMESIRGYEDRAIMVRALSNQAVDMFADNSLDYVYIDGNHAYSFVREDLKLWWPKLKSGGLMAGHDFLLLNWNDQLKLPNGKDLQVYSDGHRWAVANHYNPNSEIPFAGTFGVNPAVHEFATQHGVDYDLTREWSSTFLITKP